MWYSSQMNANLVPSIFGTTQWELRALSQLAHFWLVHKIQTIFYTLTVSSIFLLHCENYQLRWIGSREQKSKFINIMKYIRQGFHFFFLISMNSSNYNRSFVRLFSVLLPESQSIHRDRNVICLLLFVHSMDEMYLMRVFINYTTLCVYVFIFLFIRSFVRFVFAASKYITQTHVMYW